MGGTQAAEARAIMTRLRADAARIAQEFGLRYRAIESERPGVNGHYGLCTSDGLIRIRLRHASSGRPLKYSSLVNTLCHELAHLKHFNHGPIFQAFNQKLLEWARREAIYQPGRRAPRPQPTSTGKSPEPLPGASQLELFG
jgi:predicted metal-dependent hydrolase